MKNLILTLFLITNFMMRSQNYNQSWSKRDKHHYIFVSSAVDIRNALVGSKPTNNIPKLDILLETGVVSRNIQVSLFYENFNAINYNAYGVKLGYIFFILNKTDLYGGLEYSWISRYKNLTDDSQGINIEIRQIINDKLIISLNNNLKNRRDIQYRQPTPPLRYSLSLGLTYTFQRNK